MVLPEESVILSSNTVQPSASNCSLSLGSGSKLSFFFLVLVRPVIDGIDSKKKSSEGFDILGPVFSCDLITLCCCWSSESQTMPHLLQKYEPRFTATAPPTVDKSSTDFCIGISQ